jgi:hypothetical protein
MFLKNCTTYLTVFLIFILTPNTNSTQVFHYIENSKNYFKDEKVAEPADFTPTVLMHLQVKNNGC